MINISFKGSTNDPIGEIIKDVDIIDVKLKKTITELGPETASKMKEIVQSNKVRPQAEEPMTLETSITHEPFEAGWGVGDVELLKKEAPYWAAINWGSKHMVGKRLPKGTFQPGVGNPTNVDFRSGRWKKGMHASVGGSLYSPKVGKEIFAMNYIERTIKWLEDKFLEVLDNQG